jgi:hypothetical protein
MSRHDDMERISAVRHRKKRQKKRMREGRSRILMFYLSLVLAAQKCCLNEGDAGIAHRKSGCRHRFRSRSGERQQFTAVKWRNVTHSKA